MATLTVKGRTPQGHIRLVAESRTSPGTFNEVLVCADGTRVSCNCLACRTSKGSKKGWRTVDRSDVLAGRVSRCCWLLRHAARWAPLRDR